jgi:hypothetical protein
MDASHRADCKKDCLHHAHARVGRIDYVMMSDDWKACRSRKGEK